MSLSTNVVVQSATPQTAAKASADSTDVGMPRPGARATPISTWVKTAAGWRIHDIVDAGEPSLRKTLADDIESLKHPNREKALRPGRSAVSILLPLREKVCWRSPSDRGVRRPAK